MGNIDKLLEIMASLRDRESGCPWDIEQDFASIAPHTIEEAYEVADAIERGDHAGLKDELGDLLLQVVFHAQMAQELELFDFDAVAAAINAKLVRRHPHVFAGTTAGSAAEQHSAWEAHKQAEREAAGTQGGSALDGVTPNLPSLTLALKTSKKAARAGFDWENADQVIGKIQEEIAELEVGRAQADQENIREELGDLLLAVTNLARHLDVDPEQALRAANRKFASRFRKVEQGIAAEQAEWSDFTAAELEERWQAAKGE